MKMKILNFITLAMFCVLSACEKDTSLESTATSAVDLNKPFVKFMNASPGSPIINFYMDNIKMTGTYTVSGTETGIAYAAIYPSLGYSQSTGSSGKISTKIAGSSTVDPGVSTNESTVNLAAGKYYSVFAVDQYDAVTKKQKLLVIEDKNPPSDTTKAFLRFVNLQVKRAKVDVSLSTGEKLFSGIDYLKETDFVSIPNPGKESTYILKDTSTGAIIPLTLKLTLAKGRAYTLVLRGVAGTTTGANAHAATIYY